MTTVKPLGNRILVKRAKAETKKGGIILPDTAQEKPKKGTVISVGPGEVDSNGHLQSTGIKAGDQILFSSYAGTEVKVDQDSDHLILSANDVLGILS